MNHLLSRAIDLMMEVHNGQFRKDNKTPYFLHPLQVMINVAKKNMSTKVLVAAVLHDVIEDCNITFQDTLKDRIYRKFGPEVYTLLLFLTHFKHQSYDEYIRTICKNKDAILIKLEDIQDNMNSITSLPTMEEQYEAIQKYTRAKQTLLIAQENFQRQEDIYEI